VAGALSANGNVTLGDAAADTLTVTASMTTASTLTANGTLAANGNVALGNTATDTVTFTAVARARST